MIGLGLRAIVPLRDDQLVGWSASRTGNVAANLTLFALASHAGAAIRSAASASGKM
jgi:hypothetical protein